MHRRSLAPVNPTRSKRQVRGATILVALAAMGLLIGLPAARPARAQAMPDTISGFYIHESDPRATIKLLLAPSEKNGQPVDRVWGVVSFKDPKRKADSCMFEFQSTVKSDVITCRDAMNPGCALRLQLVDRTVILDADQSCLAVYCKGQGLLPRGIYVRTTKGAKKAGLP